jgi:hypothetical protein
MADIPLSPEAKITVEPRGAIVLIGVNRPQIDNRFDPDSFYGLAKACAMGLIVKLQETDPAPAAIFTLFNGVRDSHSPTSADSGQFKQWVGPLGLDGIASSLRTSEQTPQRST